VLRDRFTDVEVYFLDEPEAALDLDLVQTWRSYLDAPGRYLRHLLDD
jgi:predicted ATPase